MASPSLVSQTFSQSAGVTDTTFSPTLSTHAAGDMLEVDVGADDNIGISITSGSGGWTKAWELQNTQGSTTPTYAKFYKLAASSSESLGLTGTAGQAWGASCRVYRGAGGTLNYYTPTPVDGTDSGSSANGQGSAVAPGAGSQDFTFTSCIVQDGVQGASAGPSGYGNFQTNANTTASRVEVSTSEKAATASSDTPGAWTSAAEQWIVGGGAVWESAGGTTHAATGALTGQGSTVAGSAAHIAIHGASGALTGPGSSVVGSAARTRAHPTSGDLTGPGSSIVGSARHNEPHPSSGDLVGPGSVISGSAARTHVHPSSGDLVGPGSTVAGSAARTRVHPSSGALSGPGSEISGSAARTRVHPSSGDLVGPGAEIVGDADHQGAAGTHDTTGALVGQGSTVAGSAARFRAFSTSGVLTGPGSVIVGSAARVVGPVSHATSGVLVGLGSVITGSAARAGAAVSHNTSGALIGPGALIAGVAQNGELLIDTHDGFWVREWKKMIEREKKLNLEDVIEIVEESPQEVLEALPEVRKEVKKEFGRVDYQKIANNLKMQTFIAERILIQLEIRKLELEEDDLEVLLLM